jgi:hypothetical protein
MLGPAKQSTAMPLRRLQHHRAVVLALAAFPFANAEQRTAD